MGGFRLRRATENGGKSFFNGSAPQGVDIKHEKEGKMNKHLLATVMAALLVVSLVGCQNKPVGPVSPFTPAAIDPQGFSKKVDTFVIVMDASETMGDMYQGRRKADIAKDIVAHMNQTIPPYDYRAGLVAFGSGSCLDSKDSKVLYGMTTYRRADLASGLETLKCVGGSSPMSEGIAAGHASLAAVSAGQTALIIISDGVDIYATGAEENAQKLKAAMGDKLCIYPILVGDDKGGKKLMDGLAKIGGCGFAVNAADISSPSAMADYVKKVFLAPAAPKMAAAPVAAVELDSDGDGVPGQPRQVPGHAQGREGQCRRLLGAARGVLRQRQVRDQGPAGAGRGGRHS